MTELQLSKISREWRQAINSATAAIDRAATLLRLAPVRLRAMAETQHSAAVAAKSELLADLNRQVESISSQNQG